MRQRRAVAQIGLFGGAERIITMSRRCKAVPTVIAVHGERVSVGQPAKGRFYIEIDDLVRPIGAVLEPTAARELARALEAAA
jgi:hypothetical protein